MWRIYHGRIRTMWHVRYKQLKFAWRIIWTAAYNYKCITIQHNIFYLKRKKKLANDYEISSTRTICGREQCALQVNEAELWRIIVVNALILYLTIIVIIYIFLFKNDYYYYMIIFITKKSVWRKLVFANGRGLTIMRFRFPISCTYVTFPSYKKKYGWIK